MTKKWIVRSTDVKNDFVVRTVSKDLLEERRQREYWPILIVWLMLNADTRTPQADFVVREA